MSHMMMGPPPMAPPPIHYMTGGVPFGGYPMPVDALPPVHHIGPPPGIWSPYQAPIP